MQTKEKKARKPRKPKNTSHYLIHAYMDKERLIHVYSAPDVPRDKTKANKFLTELVATDLMHNRYYHYDLIEQTFTIINTYPN